MSTDGLDIARMRADLHTIRVGRRIAHAETVPSTNDEAWKLLDAPDADGLVFLAEHQSAGRGRLGRRWESPPCASLLCSVVLVDPARELSGGMLSLASAVVACDAVLQAAGRIPTIKWPNDLLVSGKKLGGILIESRKRLDGIRAYVVGIGINCLQQPGDFAPPMVNNATSLRIETGHHVDRTSLAIALISHLDEWMVHSSKTDAAMLKREWLARAAPLGQRVCVRREGRTFSGSILDIDPTAALIVQLDDGGIRAFNLNETEIPLGPASEAG